MTPEQLDEAYEKQDAFLKEFKALVRKYVPVYDDDFAQELLPMLQDCTSCYQPYVWDDSPDE